MQTILVVFHLFLAVGLIGLILIQHGKGADMGAAFGSGASGTVFGSKGSASFLTRLTAGLATLFFITSMVMAYYATQRDDGSVVLDALQQQPAAAIEEVQPQTDLPPMPAAPDASAAPTEENQDSAVPVVPEAVVPAAPATENIETPTASPADEPAASDAASTAPATSPADEPAASSDTASAAPAAEADQAAEQKE
jgi:preprotein translocase subunit SecG